MWAAVPLTIDGRNIDDLSVRLELGKRMTGRVVFEGAAPAPNLPPVAVYGLTIDAKAGVLYAATHGRGVWRLKLPDWD